MESHGQVAVRVDGGVVRATLTGQIGRQRSARAIELAAQAAGEAHSELLLFDVSQARFDDYHTLVLDGVRRVKERGIGHYRIAILGAPGDKWLAYMEDVAANRGLRARAFTEERDALEWLHARAP